VQGGTERSSGPSRKASDNETALVVVGKGGGLHLQGLEREMGSISRREGGAASPTFVMVSSVPGVGGIRCSLEKSVVVFGRSFRPQREKSPSGREGRRGRSRGDLCWISGPARKVERN